MKTEKRMRIKELERDFSILTENQQRGIVGGYTWAEAESMMDHGTWTGGFVDGMGYVGAQVVIFNESSSSISGNYYSSIPNWVSSQLMTSLSDAMALAGLPPIISQGATIGAAYFNNQILQCLIQTMNSNVPNNEPIFVSVTNFHSYDYYNLQIRVTVYSARTGTMLAQSDGSWDVLSGTGTVNH